MYRNFEYVEENNTIRTKIAIFDVDYTLITIDSMIYLLFWSIKKKASIILYIPIILFKLVIYYLGIIDIKKAKEAMYIPIKFLSANQLEEFYEKVLLNKINKTVMNRLELHKNAGYYILLVSSSPENYLKYFSRHKYIDGVIGTKLIVGEKKYANKIEGENCKGIEKVKRIHEYLEKEGLEIDYNYSFAYSDSSSDKPMLTLVKNSYKVDKINGIIGEFK